MYTAIEIQRGDSTEGNIVTRDIRFSDHEENVTHTTRFSMGQSPQSRLILSSFQRLTVSLPVPTSPPNSPQRSWQPS